jgi:hypothetical protein
MQNAEILIVKSDGTYSYHSALNGSAFPKPMAWPLWSHILEGQISGYHALFFLPKGIRKRLFTELRRPTLTI